MTTNRQPLTDAALRGALAELAAGPDSSALVADVLRTVDATPQAGGLAWPRPFGWRQLAIVAVTGVLLAGLVGVVALSSGPVPDPQPAPGEADGFIRPFEYQLPSDDALNLSNGTSYIYRFEGSGGGIVVFDATRAQVHTCPEAGLGRVLLRPAAMEFVADLSAVGGIGVASTVPVGIDGYTGVRAEITGVHQCPNPDIHFRYIGIDRVELADNPGWLTVVDVDGVLVGVWTWAAQVDDLEEWQARGNLFIASMDFQQEP